VHSVLLLVIVVVAATAFDFTNGFHDTANVVASSISTRALAPRTAIAWNLITWAYGLPSGAGAAKRLSAVRWGVAGTIAAAWVITLPTAGLLGAGAYAIASAFGHGALGPLLIAVVAVGGPLSMTLAARRRQMTRAASA
jgi:phosphate/sulfate permease